MNKDSNTSQDLLNDAIREASSEPATARRAAPSRPAPSAPSADLRSVLNDLAGGAPPVRSTSSSASPAGAGINDLIREASRCEGSPVSTPTPAKPNQPGGAGLGDVVQDAHTSEALADPDAGNSARHGSTLRRLGLAALAVVLLAGGAALWWSPTQLSGPAGTLHDLALGVEQHRANHNGELPKDFAMLPAFPKNAVEWPLRYWNARDAAGRTEIIWVPQSGHYRIVLRQGSEVWTVSDRESKPKPVMKGNP